MKEIFSFPLTLGITLSQLVSNWESKIQIFLEFTSEYDKSKSLLKWCPKTYIFYWLFWRPNNCEMELWEHPGLSVLWFSLFSIPHPYFSVRALQDRAWFSFTSYTSNHEQILGEHLTSGSSDNSPSNYFPEVLWQWFVFLQTKTYIFPLPSEDKHAKEMNYTYLIHISFLFIYLSVLSLLIKLLPVTRTLTALMKSW